MKSSSSVAYGKLGETDVAAKRTGCRCRRVSDITLQEVIRKRAPQEAMVQRRCKLFKRKLRFFCEYADLVSRWKQIRRRDRGAMLASLGVEGEKQKMGEGDFLTMDRALETCLAPDKCALNQSIVKLLTSYKSS